MTASISLWLRATFVAAGSVVVALSSATAQETPRVSAAPAAATTTETAPPEPIWARGRPRTTDAMKLAPVPAFPIPTAQDKLPTAKMKVPAGFTIEPWVSGVLDARGMRQGNKGTVFVSSRVIGSKVYAVTDEGGTRKVTTMLDKLQVPAGIELHKESLYIATPKQVLKWDNIEAKVANPGAPTVVYDKLPGDLIHGAKYLRVHNDKLYLQVGSPCNNCEQAEGYGTILRMNLDGSGVETIARGIRNTVGFDFEPKSGELWFTDNGRDWVSEDMPQDELNRLSVPGQHFGFPYCHQGDFTDPDLGWGKRCSDYTKPVALLGAHAAALGLHFYTGQMFPQEYQGAMFIARHGPWNRSEKYADVLVAWPDDKGGIRKIEPFLTGLVEDNKYLARPVDFLVLKDGSMLVSDDFNGAIYRITYNR